MEQRLQQGLPTLVFLWLLGVNLWAFLLMGADKGRAKRGVWRISHRVLLLPALLGGAPGSLAGMGLFRHKTRTPLFRLGLPLLLLAQLALTAWGFAGRSS